MGDQVEVGQQMDGSTDIGRCNDGLEGTSRRMVVKVSETELVIYLTLLVFYSYKQSTDTYYHTPSIRASSSSGRAYEF